MAGGNLIISSTPLPVSSGVINIGPLTITVANPLGDVTPLTFVAAQTIAVAFPNTTTAVLIVPPAANAVELDLLGANTDLGVRLSPSNPSLLAVFPGATSLMLKSAAAIPAGPVQCLFL